MAADALSSYDNRKGNQSIGFERYGNNETKDEIMKGSPCELCRRAQDKERMNRIPTGGL
jgi:hypothetical protein